MIPASSDPATTPLILRRKTKGPSPLSFAQQRLWLFDQLEPRSPLYNIVRAVELKGQLDLGALRAALDDVVARHEVLRTTLHAVEGRPVQIITPPHSVDLPILDLESDAARSDPDVVHTFLVEEARRPFDISRDLMLRAKLFRLHAEEHVLLLTVHHIAFDGWSLALLFEELSAGYAAHASGRQPILPGLPIQYADYAQWQGEWLRGARLERELTYWKQQLAGLGPLELPTDRPRPMRQTSQGGREAFRLSDEVASALRLLGRQERVTLFMILLAAFQTLLHRYTGQTDIAVGSPIAGRTHAELEVLIGFFVNTLVFRTDLSGDPTFRELLTRVREVALGAYEHQDLPFEKLVAEIQPPRTLSHMPLFQTMFALNNTTTASLALPGITARVTDIETGTAHCDLSLLLEDTRQAVTGWMEYSTDLFDSTTIRRMLGHFETMLRGIAADPGRKLSALPLMSEPERWQILVEWNDTRRDYPADRCIHDLFEAQAARAPNAVALAYADESLTYGELDRRANQLAHHLRALGVGVEVPVGICVERSFETIVGLLGILKAGGAYVPFDPTYPKQRLALMLEDTRAPVLLTQQRLLAALPDHGARVVALDAEWPTIRQQSEDAPIKHAAAENLAYVMYTSGSTGKPKGVSVPHRAVVRLVKNTDYAQLTEDEVFLQLAPLSFDASTFEIWGSLLNGARLAIFPPGVPSVAELRSALRRYHVSTLWLTAVLFHQLVEEDIESLGPVRQLLAGGDVLSVPHVERVLRERPGCRLINGYGPTESTTFACCFPVTDVNDLKSSVPIGRPLANTRAYVLGPHQEPVPVGVPGELYIGGDGLARGYLNRAELTAERFVSDPFDDRLDARLYRTGDLVRYRADGNLEFIGRADRQVKIRGFRVELGEIETVLGQHPAVRQVVVAAREEAPGDKRINAYFETRGTSEPLPEELRRYLAERLPAYMIPSAFVRLRALPLTPSGKVDRQALPVPGRTNLEAEPAAAGPRDAVEARLVKLWEEVLRTRPVGIMDDFFQLGGHSLLATRLVARIEQAFGKRIPLAALFASPTVAQLAAVLRDEDDVTSRPRVARIQPHGNLPPFFCVGAFAFFRPLAHGLGADQPFLGLSLDTEALPIPFRLEDVAAYHVQTIREVQTHGPYFLGGWSANGAVAYEIAQQLRDQGEDVALLVLFDAMNPVASGPVGALAGLRHVTQTLGFHWQKLRLGGLREAPAYIGGRLETVRRNFVEYAWRVRYAIHRRAGLPIEGRLRAADQVVLSTFWSYRPRSYPGRVVLFRSTDRPPYADTAVTWHEVLGDGLEIHDVPGDHETMFVEPHVEVLARELRVCLDAARGVGAGDGRSAAIRG